MSIRAKRMLILTVMLATGMGLMIAMVHRSASGSLISSGGLLAGVSLLLNTHLFLNKVEDIPAAAKSTGYDRRSHFYSRAAALLVVAGIVMAFIGH
ncbi:hypothetical protein [Rhodanobacter sp. OR87]|uniref:hypothetical protein n=1 Tax=Rhodanobacter sp. OR87 TaxID=1076523 RepID=UPI0012DC1977|nr:hypothetical protein [Rhodanobacter sp. OR87]